MPPSGSDLESPIPILVGTPVPPIQDRSLRAMVLLERETQLGRSLESSFFPPMMYLTRLDISKLERPGITRTIAGVDVGVTICEDAWQHCGATPNDYDMTRLLRLLNGVDKVFYSMLQESFCFSVSCRQVGLGLKSQVLLPH